jgi:carbonic anhydrase/acetyltransferase-like protein (isoleucine patch superfamily)
LFYIIFCCINKNMKKLLVSLATLILCLFVVASPADAKVMIQEKGSLRVAEKEIINDDLFIGAETVEISGTVNGDVFVGGGVVIIDGVINGDLVVGGGNLTISGSIRDDIYMGGGNIVIRGSKIGGSLVVGAGTLQIDEESVISGSLIAGTGTINSKADVARNVMIGAGSAILESKINGEVRIAAGDITFGDETNIGGDLSYILDDEMRDLVIPQGATVSGEIKKIEGTVNLQNKFNRSKEDWSRFANSANKGFAVVSYLGALLIGFIWLKIRGDKAVSFAQNMAKESAGKLLTGFAILIFTIPVAVLLMITIIGIPLSVLVLTVYGLLIYFAKIVVGLAVGVYLTKLMNWNKLNIYLVFTLGLLAVYLLKSIPVFGFFAGVLVTSLGLGSIFSHFRQSKV